MGSLPPSGTSDPLPAAAVLEALDSDDLCLVLLDQVDEALAHLANRVTGTA